MIYNEANMINVNYILPYAPIVNNITLCDRDEIADPYKLLLLINTSPKNWSVYHYNNRYFYSILIPWHKIYNSYGNKIESHYFRVLCQNPSMFILQNINTGEWFEKNYNKLFLISHIITSSVSANNYDNLFIKKYISKNNNSLLSLNTIVQNSDEEMNMIIDNKCYTICNGVIILLALQRLNIIDPSIAKYNLEMLSQNGYKMYINVNNINPENIHQIAAAAIVGLNAPNINDANDDHHGGGDGGDGGNGGNGGDGGNDGDDDGDGDYGGGGDDGDDGDDEDEDEEDDDNNIFNNIRVDKTKIYSFIQQVNDDWEELYYAFPLVQLADHPIYYIYAGPNFVDLSVKKLFTGTNEINIYWPPNNAAYYSFAISAIFPYFDITYMNEYISNLRIRNIFLDRADDLMNPNEEAIEINNDYAGLLQVFYKTNNGYTYWNINKAYISNILFNSSKYRECYKFIKIAFHYYIHEMHEMHETYSTRISNIWCDILNNAFTTESATKQSEIIIRITMKLYIYYCYSINSINPINPINPINNILDSRKLKIPLEFIKYIVSKCSNTHIHKIYTVHGIVKTLQMKLQMQKIFTSIIFEPQNGYEVEHDIYSYKLPISLFKMCNLVPIHKAYIEKIITTRLLCLKHFTNDHAVYLPINEYIRNNPYLLF